MMLPDLIVINRITAISKEQFAMCMVMRYGQGLPVKDIGAIVGVSESLMYRLFHHGQLYGFEIFNQKIVKEGYE